MKSAITVLFTFLCFIATFAQVTVIGHNRINNEKLVNTRILVMDGANTVQSVDTKSFADFKLRLEFGKLYRIYFYNSKSPVMFMEVVANTVPVDKYAYNMIHELDIPFYYKTDEDIDTTVFSKPFAKIIFNGSSKMISDTAYANAFDRKILKQKTIAKEPAETKQEELPVLITGRAILNNDVRIALTNKTVALLDTKGQVIKSTKTNRFGAFAFTGVKYSAISKIKIEAKENDLNGGQASIINSSGTQVVTAKCAGGVCDMSATPEQVKSLIDNNYACNIGGKLVHTSPATKKFFAGKTVYLCNKYNTVIKKTITNILGTFVFEDLKPDNTYFVGVDAGEVGKGERIDLLNKDDKLVSVLDTTAGARKSMKVKTDYNTTFNDISISDDEMKMNVKARLFGDNTNNPIGRLKILLLNDSYQVIDSAMTDDFGTFRFKYLPFLKRFYLSAENTNNILDVFNNILVYSSDDNLLKIMTHEKGNKFSYKPMPIEMSKLKEIEIEDPWLDLVSGNNKKTPGQRSLTSNTPKKTIVENILFDNNKYELLPQAKQILDKVILVMNANKKIRIELSAHTDSKGNDADNLKLSQMRAKAVKDYINSAGIEDNRITYVGYGESKPLNKCVNNVDCSELEHAQNRRVEFKILDE